MTFTHHLSLMHGWVPTTVQIITAVALIAAIGWRTRRWRLIWLPLAAVIGGILVVGTNWYIKSQGLAGDGSPAPHSMWIWIALSGVAMVVLVAGWRGNRWWRRGTAALAVPLTLLCTALAVNLWVGYFPWVQTAWSQLTAGPLPDQTDQVTVTAMQRQGTVPARGTVVPVEIPNSASGFRHRGEYVYLPPAWFTANPAPRLPTVMMVGGEFNTPADWMRAGNVVMTMDDFAAAHHGNAPVLVFVDAGGTFNNDTECVNGNRGNSADHLTKDVVPYMNTHYGVSPVAANWGVVGWSMGGTCAVDLAVMHPELFSAFVDIAGDIGPNSGTKAQTIERLFGGNATAWDAFDPSTVIRRHGQYEHMAGWFDVNDSSSAKTAGRGNDQARAAKELCALGSANGIACSVVTQKGTHDWPFASRAFSLSLPWLAGVIGTPQVPAVGLPKSSPSAAYIQTAAK
ncbi:S-formylglutathione hydrolase FrmB [Mycobacterium frederiksbergense]|uniref:S-formylglutathione hydrolase FrmB n=1 Tax=Mycolicibacterium frederiksbergense TaxID=117567 RepID=A0ABT6KWZ6_9MYCO|nr:alpha/beta hydrolase-fold protein [Mycolicibacterium frederiksbergense]MDH6195238.1 S-formylglutathione hydrolase FrmB [Mycolicibacterium frederiksbergense]